MVEGTLGLALVFVFVPILWRNVGALFIILVASDTLEKLGKNAKVLPDASWRLQVVRQIVWLPIFLLVACYPTTAALYLLIQLQYPVEPYRILWQVIGAAGYAIQSVIPPKWRSPIDRDETDKERNRRRQYNWERARFQTIAAIEVLALVFVADRGSRTAQEGAVVFVIWVLTAGSTRQVVRMARMSRYKQSYATFVQQHLLIPRDVWTALTFVYVGLGVVIVTRTLVSR